MEFLQLIADSFTTTGTVLGTFLGAGLTLAVQIIKKRKSSKK